MKLIPKPLAAYLAGLFDGEGSILCFKRGGDARYPSIRLSLSNTNFECVELIQETFGGGHSLRTPKNPKHLPQLVWRLSTAEECREALQTMLPYLLIKRDKALAALVILGNRPGRGGKGLPKLSKEVEEAFSLWNRILYQKRDDSNFKRVSRVCPECLMEYSTRLYRPSPTCSQSCGLKRSWRIKKNAPA